MPQHHSYLSFRALSPWIRASHPSVQAHPEGKLRALRILFSSLCLTQSALLSVTAVRFPFLDFVPSHIECSDYIGLMPMQSYQLPVLPPAWLSNSY